MDGIILDDDTMNPLLSTYAAAALLRCLVDKHCKRHPVAVLQLLSRQALRHLRQADQSAVCHLPVHLAGGYARFPEEEESRTQAGEGIHRLDLAADPNLVVPLSPESQP